MCEMVEYASMRFRLVCAIAVMLPIASDATAMMISIHCHCSTRKSAPSPVTSRRIMNANAASLGAEPMNSVTAVGAP